MHSHVFELGVRLAVVHVLAVDVNVQCCRNVGAGLCQDSLGGGETRGEKVWERRRPEGLDIDS